MDGKENWEKIIFWPKHLSIHNSEPKHQTPPPFNFPSSSLHFPTISQPSPPLTKPPSPTPLPPITPPQNPSAAIIRTPTQFSFPLSPFPFSLYLSPFFRIRRRGEKGGENLPGNKKQKARKKEKKKKGDCRERGFVYGPKTGV